MVISSAPGKLFLLGEHAVVYGYPALVAAVDKRIQVTAQVIDNKTDQFILPDRMDVRFVSESVRYFKKKFSITDFVQISTQADFSDKVGFGSSAAVTVATVASLNKLFNHNLSHTDIFSISYDIVRKVQTVASGADIAAVVYGGIVRYQKKEKTKKVGTEDILSLLVVGYSGTKADTVELIKKVQKMYEEKKVFVEKLFSDIAELVKNGYQFLEKKEYQKFGECMNENHILLKKLGVSTSILDTMVESALDNGAWGAKLSGAGGGDCMIAISPTDKRKQIEEGIQRVGGEIMNVIISPKGVAII